MLFIFLKETLKCKHFWRTKHTAKRVGAQERDCGQKWNMFGGILQYSVHEKKISEEKSSKLKICEIVVVVRKTFFVVGKKRWKKLQHRIMLSRFIVNEISFLWAFIGFGCSRLNSSKRFQIYFANKSVKKKSLKFFFITKVNLSSQHLPSLGRMKTAEINEIVQCKQWSAFNK